MSPPQSPIGIARSIRGLRARVDGWRQEGRRIALIPTMGALHAGHVSLVKLGARLADRTVASIFVNPKQFAASEDLSTYPRQEAADIAMLEAAGCSLAYCPPPEEMYPAGFATAVTVGGPAEGLESGPRPHFFGGVATVVLKLLNQCRPDVAVFGEKDYQQLQVVRRLARDLDLGIEIVGGPTLREADGLAMSSRNVYLSTEDRAVAGRLNGVLRETADAILSGVRVDAALAEGRRRIEATGFQRIDYLEARDSETLAALDPGPLADGASARLLVAVLCGSTRLIDNWPIERKAAG
ncbi:MAG: pantoate--beta-alanine ligase [Parvularculaceae bacterium]|nr:pantoate--beta-alanine ligase [Parvularculaceae bacterium]